MWVACVWGAGGGLMVELLEIYRAIRRVGGLPWKKDPEHEPQAPALFLAVFIRTGVGAFLAAGMASGGQISGSMGALTAGVAAPLVIDQLGQMGARDIRGESAAGSAPGGLPASLPRAPSPPAPTAAGSAAPPPALEQVPHPASGSGDG